MINFIYGRAGSGKTSHICRAAADDIAAGRRVFLIVPEQMAVDAETRMTDLLGNTPSLKLEILNFRRLCNRVFREYGNLSYNYITKSGKQLVMWKALAELSSADKPLIAADRGNVEKMLAAVSEFKAYRISPSELELAAKKLSGSGASAKLTEKLYDLSLIYALYTNLMRDVCDDASDDLTKAAELLGDNDLFGGTNVYFDSFNGFTPQEFEIIEKIMKQADNVTVSLCLDAAPEASRDELFANQCSTAEQLKKAALRYRKSITETVLSKNCRTAVPELKFLESSLWSLDITDNAYTSEAPALTLTACPDLFSECEAAAADICRRVRNGATWRDHAVITRGIERYDGILDAIFEKYGIPHFVSRRVDIKTKPLIKLILSALTIRTSNYRTADVISYIKTGLCGITPDEISKLENYAELWRIRGSSRWNTEWDMNPAGYTAEFNEKSAILLTEINGIRERVMIALNDLYASLDSSFTVRDRSRSVYEYLLRLEIPQKLESISAAQRQTDPAAAQETEQLFSILIDTFDELCTVMPDSEVSVSEYTELLKIVFDSTDIGRIPCTVDEVVSGDASLIRAACRHVYIIGANEGLFPLAPSDDGVFTDSERELLRSVGVMSAGGIESRAADERFAFYRALASASESVNVIWSVSDLSGHSMKPSFGVTRICALFPGVKVTSFAELPLEKRLEGRANILEFIASADGTPLGAALREYASQDPELAPKLAKLEIPLSSDCEKLSEETCKELFPHDLALTQSRLDTFVLCHFSYFCKYILKLEENKSSGFDAADIGTFIHHILESFIARAESDGGLDGMSEDELNALVDDIITDYMVNVCRISPEFSGSRINHLFDRLRRSSRLLCGNLAAEFSQSRFRPAFFELPIRMPAPDETAVEPLKIRLDDGTDAYIYGVADRVDILHHEDTYYVRVVDYKTGSKDFSLDDVSMGLNMQMLLYLFSIWKNGSNPKNALEFAKNSEIMPAGVLYFSAGVPTVTLDAEASPDDVIKMASDKLSRKGLLLDSKDVLSAMDRELDGTYLPVKIKKDGTFSGGDSLMSLDGFRSLLSGIEDTVKRISSEIKRGIASANPIKNKKHDACAYCEMRPICRKSTNSKGGM